MLYTIGRLCTVRRFDGFVIRRQKRFDLFILRICNPPSQTFMIYIFFFFRVPLASLGFPPR